MPFNDRVKAGQLINFDGLRWGKKSMSDIDAMFEYKNKLFVVIEYKYKDSPLPLGQKIALTTLVDTLNQVKPALLIIASHSTPSHEGDIDAASAIVTKMYGRNGWINISDKPQQNVKSVVERFVYDKTGDKL